MLGDDLRMMLNNMKDQLSSTLNNFNSYHDGVDDFSRTMRSCNLSGFEDMQPTDAEEEEEEVDL